jgi:peptide/nickel transport system permease protein
MSVTGEFRAGELPVARADEPARRGGARGGYWRGVARRLRRDPVTVVCGLILLTIVILAIAAPLVAPANPYKTSMLNRLLSLGASHYMLGTDELGRDMLTRLIYGGRLSLFMGLTPVVNALLIGGALGILAG